MTVKRPKRDAKGHYLGGETPNDVAYTAEQQVEIKMLFSEAYEQHFNVSLAAKAAGVSKGTIYKFRKQDPAFDAEVRGIRSSHLDNVVEGLYVRATNPKTNEHAANTAAAIILNSHRPKQYREKQSAAAQGNITFQFIVGAKPQPQPQLAEPQADVTITSTDVSDDDMARATVLELA